MFGFVKKCFFTGLALLSTLRSINLSRCISITNETRHKKWKRVNANVDLMQAFVIANNVGMIINAGVNVSN